MGRAVGGDLEKVWSRTTGGRAGMRWHEVKDAVRDAWERLRVKLSREPAHAGSRSQPGAGAGGRSPTT
jgi:hypothetical protein